MEKNYIECKCENSGIIFKIDAEDYDRVKSYHWYSTTHGVHGHVNGQYMTLSHFLLGIQSKGKKILRRNKDTFDYRKSNLFSGNIYTKRNDHYEIECFDGKIIKVDECSLDIVKLYQWHVDKNNYAITKLKSGRVIKMHRLLLEVVNDSEIEVDHINRDTVDNRLSNLRIVSRSLNCFNRDVTKYNTSGCIGVYKMSGYDDKWCAQINHDGVRHYLGSFDNLSDAVSARRNAEAKYYGI